MIGVSLFVIINIGAEANEQIPGFTKSFTVAAIWVSIFLVQMPFRLKNIIANESDLIIMESNKQIHVDYKDVYWITKFDISSPWFITLKYRDINTGLDKKISYMPSKKDQKLFADDLMTQFIRNKIKINRTRDIQEPSVIKNLILIGLLSLSVLALMIYFSQDLFKMF